MNEEERVQELVFRVSGMTCDHCVAAVRAEIVKVPGVASADVALASKQVVVHGDGIDPDAVRAAVEQAGYDAQA
jgi:copper chaperone CopZ